MHICVFCSSSNAIAKSYFKAACRLGTLIGEGGHKLVNGGANVGLMEEVTRTAREAGAETIGVLPERMIKRSLASDLSHNMIVTGDMMERKAKMRDLSDAFIALPGGFGTLEEILEVITLKQLSYHNKPVIFINTNGFFDSLIKQFEISFREQFAKESYRELYHVSSDAKDAMNYIKNYHPVDPDTKWYKVPDKQKR